MIKVITLNNCKINVQDNHNRLYLLYNDNNVINNESYDMIISLNLIHRN